MKLRELDIPIALTRHTNCFLSHVCTSHVTHTKKNSFGFAYTHKVDLITLRELDITIASCHTCVQVTHTNDDPWDFTHTLSQADGVARTGYCNCVILNVCASRVTHTNNDVLHFTQSS